MVGKFPFRSWMGGPSARFITENSTVQRTAVRVRVTCMMVFQSRGYLELSYTRKEVHYTPESTARHNCFSSGNR